MKHSNIWFPTDTSTFCAFDLHCLKHRLGDAADWWTVPDVELEEVNAGNVAFFGLKSDGVYQLSFVGEPVGGSTIIHIRAPSGRIFLGAGEEVTSWREPEGLRGTFVQLPPGNYSVAAKLEGEQLSICLTASDKAGNSFPEPVRL